MKIAVCHYSLHRVFVEQQWTLNKFAEYVKELDVPGIDFHVRFLDSPETAADKIQAALDATGLELSGLSMSNNFNVQNEKKYREQIDTVKVWLKVANQVNAPVSRVFGGHINDRSNPDMLNQGMENVLNALKELVPVAEEQGVILALENHGGLPCTGKEQVEIIEKINSPYLRATIDVGNYMQAPQDGAEGTAIAAKHCAYLHFKDFRRLPDGKLKATVVGEGDIDHRKCMQSVVDAGFDDYVALEYEGSEDELTGVPKSIQYMKDVVNDVVPV